MSVEKVLSQHESVFSEGMGLKSFNVHIRLKDNAQSRFCKARPVPLARKTLVEQALDNLEAEGIIQKFTHSDWATPNVTPIKKDGTIRVCGDFKVTINLQLEVGQYPLPRIEEIYANLTGGKQFSAIDLREAYLQMEIDEPSRKYLTINTHRGLYQYQRLQYGIASALAK